MVSIGLGNDNGRVHGAGKDMLKPEGYSSSLFSLLFCTLAINILSLALPIMTLQVYDRILPNPGSGTLPVLIMGVCLAIFLEALLRLSRSYVLGRNAATYEHLMACKTMNKILHADLTQMGRYGIGEHLHRMASVAKLKEFYNGYAFTTMAELVFVPIFLTVVYYISGKVVLVPLSILLLFIIVSFVKGQDLQRALKQREDSDDKRFNFLVESLEGVHTLKAFALEKFFERRYEAMEEISTHENYNVTQETAKTFNSGAIFSHIMVAAVIGFGAMEVLQGNLTTGGLIATLLLSGRIMQPVQKALSIWAKYQDYALSRKKIEDLLMTPQQEIQPRENEAEPFPRGALEVKDVSFSYKESGFGIHDINLSLKRGTAVLLSGSHGSGKTTLLNVITGIYPSTSGEIRVDGERIDTYKPEELVRHVGFIRTRALIFRGTIRDNITCFGQTDEGQAREVAKLLEVDNDVAKLPGGFDTFLNGNSTDSIPPGLKQRIAMVRVLATKPKLIIFDNADRSLDKDGYAMIYSLLARLKGKISMILVSDDCNIRNLADTHYVMKDGTLVLSDDLKRDSNIKPYTELRL